MLWEECSGRKNREWVRNQYFKQGYKKQKKSENYCLAKVIPKFLVTFFARIVKSFPSNSKSQGCRDWETHCARFPVGNEFCASVPFQANDLVKLPYTGVEAKTN